jgi:ubiquinone/menaquinone biosynthesis C-methylase UbiE
MKFYDSTAFSYDIRHDNATTRHLRKRESQVLTKHAKGLVLDIGCGTGMYSGISQNFIGIDPSSNMIKEAKKKTDKNFALAKAENLPFASSSFDTAICMFTVLNLCEAGRAIKEMKRILKPNGAVVVSVASVWDRKNYRFIDKIRGKYDSEIKNIRIEKNRLNFRLFKEKYLVKAFEKEGFILKEMHGVFKLQEPYWNKYKNFSLFQRIKLEMERLIPPGTGRIYIAAFKAA